jgi:hypothetical protein
LHDKVDKVMFVFLKLIFLKKNFKFFYIYLLLKKLVNRKHFSIKKNLVWFLRKCFPFILSEKHFTEVVKNLEMSYYLLIISNLVLKFFIDIYFVLNIYFLISSIKI